MGKRLTRWVVIATFLPVICKAATRPDFVQATPSDGSFCLAAAGRAAAVCVSNDDFPGVTRAAGDFCQDVGRVSGTPATLVRSIEKADAPPVLAGTIGHSAAIDALIRAGRLDVSAVNGRWESYVIQTVADPMPGVKQALVVAGSDKRGTIYGLYDLSENIGVSPWYWWADVPVAHRDALYVHSGRFAQGPPAVKYRGIFLNDEAPSLTGWAKEKFGGLNRMMYTHVFELLLRLRANYLWPAMWGNAFNEDDPQNAKLADEYGIVMGTSHQEPMLRAQAEFDRRHKPDEWNYATHPDLMEQFWRQGVRRNKNYESIVTIGMRGRNDTPMIEHATTQQSTTLLEQIVARQRKIIAQEMDPDVTKVPQLWCLYKEVQGYYELGLRVPDDVTLLWSDDNWGNLRRLPTAEERKRSGGAGIYYHFDYVGDPRNYKWLNTNPLPKIQQQMSAAYRFGADRIWIVNVGDLKPMELPISFFLEMAWDPTNMGNAAAANYPTQWASRQFGPAFAQDIGMVLSRYGEYVAWRKPELLSPMTFSLINYGEAERVERDWDDLVKLAASVNDKLPAAQKDAYFQLALYPVEAVANLSRLYIAAGRNALFAKQGRASANEQANLVRHLFAEDRRLSDQYNHTMAGGKWDHMMDQTHIGYTGWQQPAQNVMPTLSEVEPPDAEAMGVAVAGTAEAWPGGVGDPTLPPFDTLGRGLGTIDVFRRGKRAFIYSATTDQPWVRISVNPSTKAPRADGKIDADLRLYVQIDWSTVPAGEHDATVTVTRSGGESVAVKLHVVHDPAARQAAIGAFGKLTEAFAIAASDTPDRFPGSQAIWQKLEGAAREGAAMTVQPPTAPSVTPPNDAPHLDYPIYFPNAGPVKIDALIAPTLGYVPGRGLRLALSLDAGPPQIVDATLTVMGRDNVWRDAVSDNVRRLTFTLPVDTPGKHTLKVWMVDAGVVLEKLIVGVGPERPSYFGPPLTVRQP